jgi:hypothetical protein
MKYRIFLINICLAFSLIIPTFSSAAIIDGYFKGRMNTFQSNDPIWSENLRGEKISGYFWYDTALAPAASPGYPFATDYSSFTNSWLNLTFYIGGKTMDISKEPPNVNFTDVSESLQIKDGNEDSFIISDTVATGDVRADFRITSTSLKIVSRRNLFNTDSLLQNFIWKGDGTRSSTAHIEELSRRDGVTYFSRFGMYISEVDVSVRKQASVPEPSTIMLLGIGLLGLIINYRKRQKIANN